MMTGAFRKVGANLFFPLHSCNNGIYAALFSICSLGQIDNDKSDDFPGTLID